MTLDEIRLEQLIEEYDKRPKSQEAQKLWDEIKLLINLKKAMLFINVPKLINENKD